jgi:EAL domain-containing protein (putative c-di-GMP-specific phosphodiesterase class I)/GGDEF domain-containing protein
MSKINEWKLIIDQIDYAFQPIVNIHTGVCLGYEALLRDYDKAGFKSIQGFFDAAFEDGMLLQVDLRLREAAIKKLISVNHHRRVKLFFNLDNRILLLPDDILGDTSEMLIQYGLYKDSICFEISERHEFQYTPDTKNILNMYKHRGYKIAIDDFGTGFSGLQLLYHSEPDFIKIDRFFISNIETDSRKKLFFAKVLNLAHILGIMVIAEGVETEKEYFICKEIGCDFAQGYLIQRPVVDVTELKFKYDEIALLSTRDMREKTIDHRLLSDQMEYLDPINLHEKQRGCLTDMSVVFDRFRKSKASTFFPVINGNDEPAGLIREKELKEYVYSKYGKDLLLNKTYGKTLIDFIIKCPICEISTRIENILEIFSIDEHCEGVILTENSRYLGFLSARSLLKVVNEKNLASARDSNPLTKLPGNTMINEYVEAALKDIENTYVLVYFDFDNFKPYNDRYGFRQGDRTILLFSDILKKTSGSNRFFVGHIGGDDFFAGFKVGELDRASIDNKIRYIVEKFKNDVVSLYDPEDRNRGYIIAPDRYDNKKEFPLLTVSAAVLDIHEGPKEATIEEVVTALASLKKTAKTRDNKIAYAFLNNPDCVDILSDDSLVAERKLG